MAISKVTKERYGGLSRASLLEHIEDYKADYTAENTERNKAQEEVRKLTLRVRDLEEGLRAVDTERLALKENLRTASEESRSVVARKDAALQESQRQLTQTRWTVRVLTKALHEVTSPETFRTMQSGDFSNVVK